MPSLPVAEQRMLSIYGTVTRYPGDYEPITVKDARKAVLMARRIKRELRGQFPVSVRIAR